MAKAIFAFMVAMITIIAPTTVVFAQSTADPKMDSEIEAIIDAMSPAQVNRLLELIDEYRAEVSPAVPVEGDEEDADAALPLTRGDFFGHPERAARLRAAAEEHRLQAIEDEAAANTSLVSRFETVYGHRGREAFNRAFNEAIEDAYSHKFEEAIASAEALMATSQNDLQSYRLHDLQVFVAQCREDADTVSRTRELDRQVADAEAERQRQAEIRRQRQEREEALHSNVQAIARNTSPEVQQSAVRSALESDRNAQADNAAVNAVRSAIASGDWVGANSSAASISDESLRETMVQAVKDALLASVVTPTPDSGGSSGGGNVGGGSNSVSSDVNPTELTAGGITQTRYRRPITRSGGNEDRSGVYVGG